MRKIISGKMRQKRVKCGKNGHRLVLRILFVYGWYMKKKKKLYRRKTELSFLYKLIRGAIGKEYVIKHYSYEAIRTKYPDMSRIIAPTKQRKCRDIFKEAVAYAKQVIADPVAKAAWQ